MAGEAGFEMIPVTSTQLAAVGYNAETQEMRIEFAKGQIYSYSGVPEATYQALMSAPSVGQFFNINVKFAFQYVRLN